MKLCIFFNEKKLSGKLTKLFTGEYAYHTAWVNDTTYYDMNYQRRVGYWPKPQRNTTYAMYDFPEVTEEFLVHKLKTDHQPYGVFDYCLFLARPLYHLLGMSTSNAKGQICSEMCNNDLRESGVSTPFTEVPSPAELYRWLDSSPVHSHRKIQIL